MQKKREIRLVYLAGLLQGLVLVTFPAASVVLLSPQDFHLTNTQYGALFLPQTLIAIITALWSSVLVSRKGSKWAFVFGLAASAVAMLLLAISALVMGQAVAYILLLVATAHVGLGFGITVPLLNRLVEQLFPQRVSLAVLALNALLGLGTALAPVLGALFLGLHIWWGFPSILVLALVFLMLSCYDGEFQKDHHKKETVFLKLPSRFWIFAAFAFLYGMVETMNGNWAIAYMKNQMQASSFLASLALAAFWTMVTVGRVFFAWTARFFSELRVLQSLPFVMVGVFLVARFLPAHSPFLGIGLFALAGWGCSALLPSVISCAGRSLPRWVAAATGRVVACYLLGYGVAAFMIGPLEILFDLQLSDLFGSFSAVALLLGGCGYALTRFRRAQ